MSFVHAPLSKLMRCWLTLALLLLASPLAYNAEQLVPVADAKQTPAESSYVHNQLIIKLSNGRTISDLDAFNHLNGVALSEKIIHGRASRADLDRLYLLEFFSTVDVQNLVARYENNPHVEFAEPNFRYSLDIFPNDPEFSKLWGLHNTGQLGGTPGKDIDAPQAWDITADSSQIVVGVIDTGVNYNHPDLAANMWRNPGEIPNNSIDDDGNGFVDDYHGYDFARCLRFNPPGTVCNVTKPRDGDPMDDTGHGTHVAGTIGAVGNNTLGVTGVSWKAKIMAIKALTPVGGLTSDLIDAVNYATMMNVKLTSNSWGGGGFSQSLFNAIQAARGADALFVASAGNGGSDGIGDNNDASPHYPSSYNLENIIAVAATDLNDNLTTFSNYGATSVDLAAPGDLIFSTWYKVEPSFADVSFDSTMIDGIPMEFSPSTSEPGITAIAQYADLGLPENFAGTSFSGKIAVMKRGSITFGEKTTNAMDAGAIGAIIFNNIDGMFSGTLGGAGNWIPTASISKSDGEFLAAQLPRQVTFRIIASNYVYLSGTSMSTPHVSGAAALLRARLPAASYTGIKNMILSSTDPLPSLAGRTVTGGRLNLFKTLDLFDFTMSNSGGITVGPKTVGSTTLTLALNAGGPQTVSLSCSGLPSGGSCSFNPSSGLPSFSSILTIGVSTSTPVGSFIITVTATGGGQTHTTALMLTVGLVGDINTDCSVNIVDLAAVGAAFGSTPATSNWNPNADLNDDFAVNIIDLTIIGSRFGRTCP